jgi:hypothetical protein
MHQTRGEKKELPVIESGYMCLIEIMHIGHTHCMVFPATLDIFHIFTHNNNDDDNNMRIKV